MKIKDQQKVSDFFNATLKLTEEVGLAGLKMSSIASEAKLASGTLYVYFKSKEDLLNELYKKLKTDSIQRLQIKNDDNSFKLAFKEIWNASLTYRIENQRETIFMMQFRNSPFINEENKQIGNQYLVGLEKFLEKGKIEQLLKNTKTEILLATIIGLLNEFAVLYNSYPILEKEDLELSFNICWDAIKA